MLVLKQLPCNQARLILVLTCTAYTLHQLLERREPRAGAGAGVSLVGVCALRGRREWGRKEEKRAAAMGERDRE